MADLYWDDVVFLSGYEGGSILDESPLAQSVTLRNAAVTTATQAKFGTRSLDAPSDGSTKYFVVPHDASMNIGTGNFTIETWAYNYTALSAGNALIIASKFDENATDGHGWQLILSKVSGSAELYVTFNIYLDANDKFSNVSVFGSALAQKIAAPTISTWAHIAVDFDGTTYRVYVDGVMVKSATTVYTVPDTTCPLMINGYDYEGAPSAGTGKWYTDETRITIGTARYASDGGFTPPVAAYDRVGPDPLDHLWTEEVSFIDDLAPTQYEAVVESVAVALDLVPAWVRDLTERVGALDYGYAALAIPVLVEAGAGVASITTETHGQLLREGVALDGQFDPIGIYQLAVAAAPVMGDAIYAGRVVALSEGSVVADALVAASITTVTELLGMSAVLTPIATYSRGLIETMRLSTSLAQFLGVDVADGIQVAPSLLGNLKAYATGTEGVSTADTVEPVLVLRVVAAEAVQITGAHALRMLFSQDAVEGIGLTVGYVSPGGGFTTWTMNTATGAVSEYDNYAFNSFAQRGNKYLGASDQGLYELNGNTDDGDDIIAQIKSGYMQFGGTHLSRLKAAYLGMRGDGDYILKIETTTGETYNYGVPVRDMRSTKVHMGKGQRARYFSFELISAGTDFDVDTIEFVPVVMQRRV